MKQEERAILNRNLENKPKLLKTKKNESKLKKKFNKGREEIVEKISKKAELKGIVMRNRKDKR